MVLGLFATKRKRSRSGGGGGSSKALETVILIGGLGALGIVGYYVLRGGKGFEEAQDTAGQALKDLVDATRSTFEAIGSASKGAQDWVGRTQEQAYKNQQRIGKFGYDVQKAVGGAAEYGLNVGCQAQRAVAGIFGIKQECTDLSKRDTYVLLSMLAGGSPKSNPKITNNMYNTMLRLGVTPNMLYYEV
jgi:hypothetical protein